MMFLRAGPTAFVRGLLILGVLLFGGRDAESAALDRITLYLAQPGTPVPIPNFISPGAGCDWWGLGGQVFNATGRPETGLVIRITGTLEGQAVNQAIITGSSLRFGSGGFDIQLADHLPTAAALSLQLFDTAGRPQSALNFLPFYSTCSQNLLVVNLRQRSFDYPYFLPFVRR